PRNELERRLVKIWEDVLGIQSIDPHSNFFDLGGHSLLAAQLFERIGREIGQQLPLALLLKAPTIRQLDDVLTQGGWVESWSSLVPIQPAGSKPPLFFVHGGGGNVLAYRLLAQHLGPDQPVWGLQAQGLDRNQAPSGSIEDMAALYLKAIRAQQPE